MTSSWPNWIIRTRTSSLSTFPLWRCCHYLLMRTLFTSSRITSPFKSIVILSAIQSTHFRSSNYAIVSSIIPKEWCGSPFGPLPSTAWRVSSFSSSHVVKTKDIEEYMEQPRSQAYFRKLVYYVMDLVLRLDRLLSDAFRFSFFSTLESTRKRPSSQSRFPTSVSSSTIWLLVACLVSAPASWKPSPARCCAISVSPPSSARSCL